jgi:hypothetical protein
MRQAQKKAIVTAALLATLTTSAGCAVYDGHDRYRSGRYDRYDRYSQLDLDRDGRVEQWELNRWDRDQDGRVEQWERNRGPYDRRRDSRYNDRFDR